MTNEVDLSTLSDEEREALSGEDAGSLADAETDAKAVEAIKDDETDALDETEADAPADDPAPAADPPAEPVVSRLAAPATEGADEQLNALLDQRKTLREQFRAGDISIEDKEQQEDELNDQILAIRLAVKEAGLVQSINTQREEESYLATVAAVKSEIKTRDGIDYNADKDLLTDLDIRVRALASDPANAEKPGRWFIEEAHKQVMAKIERVALARGFEPSKRGRKSTEDEVIRDAIAARKPPAGARSLAGLPAAAQDTGHEGSEFASINSLDGEDYENALARMTPEQQERFLRQ